MQETQEMQVRYLGWEGPLEKEMATHSSVLAWRIPGTERPGGLPSMGSHRVRHNWSDLAAAAGRLVVHMVKCLPAMWEIQVWSLGWEDPVEKAMATYSSVLAWRILRGEAWWTAVYGVAQSWAQLTWLSSNTLNTNCVCVWVCELVTQLSLTLCDPMDWGLPGSSVHEILQARIMGCVAIFFSRGSS